MYVGRMAGNVNREIKAIRMVLMMEAAQLAMCFPTKVTDVMGGGWDMEGGKRTMRAKVLCPEPCTPGNDLKTHFIQGCDSECDSHLLLMQSVFLCVTQ